MKISVILKPRQSGIWEALKCSDYWVCNYTQWDFNVLKDTFIDRIPIEETECIYNEFKQSESPYKLILWTSIKKWMEEFKRIENLFS